MNAVINEIQELLDELREKVDSLAQKVNSILSQVPFWLDWVVDRVQDAWSQMMAKLSEFFAWFGDKLAYAGDMAGLERAALDWNHDVGRPASTQSQEVDAGDLMVDDAWSGTAAEQYRQKVPDQKEAMSAIRDVFSTTISAALDTMRSGLNTFWWCVAGAIASVIAAAVGAATATGTIIGLPAAPVALAVGIVAALVALGSGISVLNSDARSAARALKEARDYGLESWPVFAL